MIKSLRDISMNSNSGKGRLWIFLFVAVLTVCAKGFLATCFANYDVESYGIVADTVLSGKSVYASTIRYNYAPAWSYILAFIKWCQVVIFQESSLETFHVMVAVALALVDVALACMLFARYSFGAGLFFLLNPVSMLITGFHTQFDNLAILVGFIGVDAIARSDKDSKGDLPFLLGVFLVGISLVLKHLLIFLPLWFLVRKDLKLSRRVLAFLLPYMIFFASFLPFVWNPDALDGVISNVFGYSVAHWAPGFFLKFVELFVPSAFLSRYLSWIPVFGGVKFPMLIAMCAAGLVFRKADIRLSFFYNLVALCVFSSQLADQYLVIPVAACAVFRKSWLMWIYVLLATVCILGGVEYGGRLPGLKFLTDFCAAIGLATWNPVAVLAVFLLKPLMNELRACRSKWLDGNGALLP